MTKPTPKFIAGVCENPCLDCNKRYVGETFRSINKRIQEHKNDFN